MCVFIHNTPRFHSQTNPTRAPATLVCAGSFISSPITGPLFPLWFWMGFKTLIIAAVTSEWRACESGDQLVFFLLLLSTCLTPWNLHVFCSHTRRQCHPALLGFGEGDLAVIDRQTSLSHQCVWATGSSCSSRLRSYERNTNLM